MEDLKKIIARNVMDLRRANDMTQLELAEKLNYTDKAVSKWERGESLPDISVLKAIADLFGVKVDYLLTCIYDACLAHGNRVIAESVNDRPEPFGNAGA